METPFAVANFFVRKSLDTGVEISPMKLIKLVYLSHGWYLGIAENPLIDEGVQAWRYGPVIETLYHEFKRFGNTPVTQMASQYRESPDKPSFLSVYIPQVTDKNTKSLLEKVWDVYKDFSAIELSAITHQEGSPWDIVWNKQNGHDRKSVLIPDNLIREYYRKKIKDQ